MCGLKFGVDIVPATKKSNYDRGQKSRITQNRKFSVDFEVDGANARFKFSAPREPK